MRSKILLLYACCSTIGLSPTLAQAKVQPISATDLALVNRVTWGVNESVMRDLEAQGTEVWLQGQLHPVHGDHLPPAIANEIDALPALHKSQMQMAQELVAQVGPARQAQAQAQAQASLAAKAVQSQPNMMQSGAPMAMTPNVFLPATPAFTAGQIRNAYLNDVMRQVEARNLLRALYASDQLREQMSWFWFNHFNVFEKKGEVRLFLADYEDKALRPNALGTFRTLLEATLRSPAMLMYLDNAQNAKGKINENYAREIMELHTLGVSTGGVGSSYAQKDVQELARILTGVGITRPNEDPRVADHLGPGAIRDGMFAFYPQRHDYGDKVFLGHVIKGSGYGEVQQALDILCAQPATARHISTQIAQYFVADQPPATLVNAMAARFAESHGDIAAVLDLMFHSAEFRASLNKPLFKDPQHYVLSAVRLAYDTRPIVNTLPIVNWLNRLAEPLYGHLTPDGYAMDSGSWNGPGQIEQRFEIAQAIGSGAAGLFKSDAPNAAAQPAFPQLQGALYYNGLAETLAPATKSGLAQANSPQEWNVFFLASPDFMRR